MNLDGYVAAMPRSPGQCGLLVCMNGKVVGLEVLSNESAYLMLHTKLIKSYLVEAISASRASLHNFASRISRERPG